MYFENIKKDDEKYSIIYGLGKANFVLPKEQRVDGFYAFSIQYDKKEIFYDINGVPDWCTAGGYQTVFDKDDINLMDYDTTPIKKVLQNNEITRLLSSDELDIRCPSGIWINANNAPTKMVTKALKNKPHLFRKKQS